MDTTNIIKKLIENNPTATKQDVLSAVAEASKHKENNGELAIYLAASYILGDKNKGDDQRKGSNNRGNNRRGGVVSNRPYTKNNNNNRGSANNNNSNNRGNNRGGGASGSSSNNDRDPTNEISGNSIRKEPHKPTRKPTEPEDESQRKIGVIVTYFPDREYGFIAAGAEHDPYLPPQYQTTPQEPDKGEHFFVMHDVIEGAFAITRQARVSFIPIKGQKGLKATRIKVLVDKVDETGYSTSTIVQQKPKMNDQWAQKYIEQYAKLTEPTDLLMELNSDKFFGELIQLPTLPAEDIIIPKLVRILLLLLDATMQEWVNKILSSVIESLFMKVHIPQYLIKKIGKKGQIQQTVQDLITLCQVLISRFPSRYFSLPIDSLQAVVQTLYADDKAVLAEQAKLQEMRARLIKVSEKAAPRTNTASYVAPPDDFRQISIFPTDDDVSTDTTSPFLRPIILDGEYDSVDHYLDIHFRLLREDFLKSLRDGINAYKNGSTEWRGDIRVYTENSYVDR